MVGVNDEAEKLKGKVSIVLVNYNGRDDLDACISSYLSQTYENIETILVDCGSSDGSVEFVKKQFPQVDIIASDENLGYGPGNALGVRHATGDYVLISNVDVEAAPDAVEAMVHAFHSSPGVGIVAPKILMFNDRDRVNACGNDLHFMGFATCRGLGAASSEYDNQEDLGLAGGTVLFFSASTLSTVGNFDLFGNLRIPISSGRTTRHYYYSAHFVRRIQLLGLKVLLEPGAVVYHKYVTKPLTPTRFTDLEYTRLLFILSTYSTGTLVVLFGLLALGELISFGFAVLNGRDFVYAKLKAYVELGRDRTIVARLRKQTHDLRRVPDNVIIDRLQASIDFSHQFTPARSVLLRVVNLFLSVSFSVARRLVHMTAHKRFPVAGR